MKRRDLVMGAAGLSALGLPGFSWAQATFPRPGMTVKYVVPFEPGGLTDIISRIIAQRLGVALGTSVVVENRSGGSAQIGADYVAKGPADGSVLLAINQAHAANVSLFPNAPFSLVKDLRPIALLADSPIAIVVPAASPLKNLRDLMQAAKARPLNAGSAGNGSGPHLALELFNDLSGSTIAHVPYRGGAPALNDLIAGRLDVNFANYPQALPHIKSGRLHLLAICSTTRHPDFPNVPTARESGMPELVMENWTGLMAPAGTPDAVVERLSSELVKIVTQPEMADGLLQRGFRVNAKGRAEFAVFLKSEVDRWGALIKKAKITPD